MVLGLIIHDRGVLDETSFETLTLARQLANDLEVPLEAVLVGDEARALVEELPAYGVRKVHLIRDDGLETYAPGAWAGSIVQLIDAVEAGVVMASGTDRGNEVMAHIAARKGLPMAANCVEVSPGDPYQITRLRWGGSLLEEATLEGEPKLMTVAVHVITPEPAQDAKELVLEEFTPSLEEVDFRVRVKDLETTTGVGVSLTDARVVIGGGRGVGSAEGFGILEQLADVLGGAVGGSRVATNNGWRPHSDQIGQTGARIAPDLYIACGISGAIQHMVGCKGAKQILAINTDSEAPMVSKADYAVIGDLHEIVPALSAEIRKLKAG
jgi:electron transfer flavoprotein alpha subunit